MSDAAIAIPNLLYTYADCLDAGDFAGAARLFRHGGIVTGGRRIEGEEAIAAAWADWVRLYDGRPRTRHITTNMIIELAEDGQSATCRSQYTVLQAVEGVLTLQPVISGRYHDRFAIIDGAWAFVEREYGAIDLMGDLSAHMLSPASGD